MTRHDQETGRPARPPRDHHGAIHAECGAAHTASAELSGFEAHLAELSGLIAPCFSRRDLRSNASAYILGLLCPGTAGNCWSRAQAAGHSRPHRLQHLLSGAVWDEDEVRDAVRSFVACHLGEGGVLIFDETGDLKKGTATAGAGRQYTGTAGRIENAVVAVYATYATPLGHALIDRELHVQKEWFADPERMAKAGFEPDHAFATKPQLAKTQAERALEAGLAPAWATGDEVYGRSSELRALFEARGIGYVFAVGCDFQLTTSGHRKMRADQALHLVEPHGWNRRSAGAGSKGPRHYDWARFATASHRHQLLIRRSISTGELAYYLAFVPDHYVCSLTDLVKAAGARWAVEDDFQDAKQAVGLDGTQVRAYRAWKRHVTLVMAAYALLAVTAAKARAAHPAPVLPENDEQHAPEDCGMIALTVPELQRLLPVLLPEHNHGRTDRSVCLAWSTWRRRHQARARWHHYRRRYALIA
ncbi:IS701 family transposase [Actinospica sp. MGRD01-02]|uniref:IS701 family transposase n=1 Tax=Actinospica acidithermotolerans TaxID=2828514 RepID=A0A941E7F8_9ACTN|nr:IS701 family transposase [Actinospica acidithermotolerans]MBR7825202.1 IS701 family transposase [Actinospica acidithermotolerans]